MTRSHIGALGAVSLPARPWLPVLLAAGLLPWAAVAQAPAGRPPPPRYLGAMQEELARVGLDPFCEAEGTTRARCSVRHVSDDGRRELVLHADYSDESDTVYLHVPRVAVAPPEDEATALVLRRTAELNWRMLTTKVEWNPSDGEVRISAVLHTDSNFDRRAFRNLVRTVLRQAERYGPELRRLAASSDELTPGD